VVALFRRQKKALVRHLCCYVDYSQTLVMSAADSIKEGLCVISQIKEKETNHDKMRGKWGSVHFIFVAESFW